MFGGGTYWGRGGILKFPEHFIFPQMYRGTLLTGWGWESWTVNLSRCSVASLPMLTEGGCVCICSCMPFIHDCISGCLNSWSCLSLFSFGITVSTRLEVFIGRTDPPVPPHLSLFILKHFKGKKHHRPCCWSHVVVYHACSPMKLFQGPMVLNPWLTSLLSLGGPLHRLSGWFLFNHQPSQT